jgi:hypothetical protein
MEAYVTMRNFEDGVRKVRSQRDMKPGMKASHLQYG